MESAMFLDFTLDSDISFVKGRLEEYLTWLFGTIEVNRTPRFKRKEWTNEIGVDDGNKLVARFTHGWISTTWNWPKECLFHTLLKNRPIIERDGGVEMFQSWARTRECLIAILHQRLEEKIWLFSTEMMRENVFTPIFDSNAFFFNDSIVAELESCIYDKAFDEVGVLSTI